MVDPVVAVPEKFNAARFFVDRHLDEGRGDRVAIRSDGRTETYAALAEHVNRVGNALRDLGVSRGQRVVLALLDGPEFAASFFGAIKVGAVPVPVNTMMRAADYRYFLEDSEAPAAIVSEPLLPEIGKALETTQTLRDVIVVGTAPRPYVSYRDWTAGASSTLRAVDTAQDDMAFWLYSSGSTGFPKGAVHRQRDMLVCTDTYGLQVLGITEDDRCVSAAKLFFAYGLGNAMYFPMRVGAEAVLFAGRPTPEAAFQVIHETRPTLFFGVPTLYAGMLQVKDAASRFDTSSLRLCVSAGESLPADLFRRWKERFGVEILDGIGTTEILHIFISNRGGRVKPGSTGLPVPGYDAVIEDDAGHPLKAGDVGNLCVHGASTMAYYWNQPEKTKAALRAEWMVTGDKYYCDEEGYFWYCGRADDMLKVGGIWVSPVEIENTLVAHPAVLEAAVIGKADRDELVKPKAFVVLRDAVAANETLAAELQAFVKEKIAPYKYPRWVEFVPDLPKTATGKLQRFRLREREAAAPPRP